MVSRSLLCMVAILSPSPSVAISLAMTLLSCALVYSLALPLCFAFYTRMLPMVVSACRPLCRQLGLEHSVVACRLPFNDNSQAGLHAPQLDAFAYFINGLRGQFREGKQTR